MAAYCRRTITVCQKYRLCALPTIRLVDSLVYVRKLRQPSRFWKQYGFSGYFQGFRCKSFWWVEESPSHRGALARRLE